MIQPLASRRFRTFPEGVACLRERSSSWESRAFVRRKPADLRRQLRKALALMVAASGRRVRRQEIAAAVWDDEDRDVRTLMWSLRRALRDATADLTFPLIKARKAITCLSCRRRPAPLEEAVDAFRFLDLTRQAEALLERRRRARGRREAHRRGRPVGRRAVRRPVARGAAGSVPEAHRRPGARARLPRQDPGRGRAPRGRARTRRPAPTWDRPVGVADGATATTRPGWPAS